MKANYEVFVRSAVVQKYRMASLQNPEIIVLLKYHGKVAGRRVIDIGCGAGRTSFFLLPIAATYQGTDYSPAMIEACRQRFPGRDFRVCDFRDMRSFGDGSFEFALFSFNGIDYVEHAGRLAGLREVHRILTPGALFVFSSHNRKYRGARARPKVTWCVNPYRQLRHLGVFLKQWQNHRLNRELEEERAEYAMLNDEALDWALLTYYISKEQQIAQLRETGFDVIDMYDDGGGQLMAGAEDAHTCWIYYVARRQE